MPHPRHVPPAVLQFALLELMAATPGSPAAAEATEKLARIDAGAGRMLNQLAELAEVGYVALDGTRFVITAAGRRLVAPDNSHDRIAQYIADGLERLQDALEPVLDVHSEDPDQEPSVMADEDEDGPDDDGCSCGHDECGAC